MAGWLAGGLAGWLGHRRAGIDELRIAEPASASRLVDAGSVMRRAGIDKTGDAGLARRCRACGLQWAGSRAHAQNPNSFLKWCRAAPLGIGGGGGLAVVALLGSEAAAVGLWARGERTSASASG